MVVHFKGGSLGGEVRVLDKFEMYNGCIRVPVSLTPPGAVIGYRPSDLMSVPPAINYSYDEYRMERQIRAEEYEFRWVRPKDLSRELEQARGELRLVEAKLASADDLIAGLKKVKKALLKVTGI